MSIKFLVLGGGYFGFWGGGSADFIFMGARMFLKIANVPCPKAGSFTHQASILATCSGFLRLGKWRDPLFVNTVNEEEGMATLAPAHRSL